jgi:hypothetical protein
MHAVNKESGMNKKEKKVKTPQGTLEELIKKWYGLRVKKRFGRNP